ncbi:MAG: 4Fe-4S dicluster domain-containing protein [Candidatus Edwardsbacteria bacterium]
MYTTISASKLKSYFVQKVEEISGQKLLACYQCGRCSAGCPLVSSMDLLPNQIVRLVQLGQEDEVLNSQTIWRCASCLTCDSRCPRGIDVSRIMDALRVLFMRKGRNYIDPVEVPKELIDEVPQIGLISAYRKFTNLT